MTRQELAAAIGRKARLEGTFRLRSGRVSNEYFDKYRDAGVELRSLFVKSGIDTLTAERRGEQ